MNAQNFKIVKDCSKNIFYQEVGKTKTPIVFFSLILLMLLLFSCKKSMNELPGRDNVEARLSNQSSSADVSSSHYSFHVPMVVQVKR